ncbi:hypothetical protein [Microbacterium testaceum]|uniref:hypothetical protein n=1 Tax=Microbacterium testaceum TaxID=2033 RepID=UPI002AC5FE2D|nr:hypothetical protein [Microbacterium testaceum]MDZ5145343.1 hypothetical protein [Microbacterium testaceum]
MSERPQIPTASLTQIIEAYHRNGEEVSTLTRFELRGFLDDCEKRGQIVMTPTMIAVPATMLSCEALGWVANGLWRVWGNGETFEALCEGPSEYDWAGPEMATSRVTAEVADLIARTWAADLSALKVVSL